MYTSFFGLNEKPFSITPDPRYLFMSERHGEALAHLVYGVTESGGFIQLTGEVGTGKTTLVRTLLLSRMPSNADVAVVLNPQQSAHEFVATICGELHVPIPDGNSSIKVCIDSLNAHLLKAHAEGKRTILVVDEAQNLAPDVLEQVRMLTNLETSKQKLLQIILIGQPELRELLARTDLRQLAQRITGRYHLEPLSRDETAQYIEHRLTVAGALTELFDKGAKRELYRLTQGIPRLINVICDRALLGAYSREIRSINKRLVRRAAAEVSGKEARRISWRWALPALMTVIVAGAIGIWSTRDDMPYAAQQVIAAPTAAIAIDPGANRVAGSIDSLPIDTLPAENMSTQTSPESAENEPQVSLDDQLQLASGLTGRNAAFTTLFELWQLEFSSGNDTVCNQAIAGGLSCFFQRGSWSGLRQLDRPAILTLTDSGGNNHAVVLVAIEEGIARISMGGVVVDQTVEAISELWFGEYVLLWKPPNGTSVALNVGSKNQNVIWLRQSLAAIPGSYRSEPLESDAFDDGLRQAVLQFQRDHRLGVDGVAGQQTQIVVNSLLVNDGSPRLAATTLVRQ